jgi:cysteinyl-tRNA synthetase
MLTLFNSMTKQKEVFKPLKPNQVSMYVCGVTVYDHCHLGHARYMIVFDIFSKYLRHLGYQVKFVSNITDIDDKIIKKAFEKDVTYDVISQTITDSMHQDAQALGVALPDVEPKATEHIEDMIHMIQTLIDKGFAYVAGNGDVCFEVNCFHGYGKLSRQDLNQLMAGVRIDASEQKRSPADFVLWKQAKPGEPSWSSPWGLGRPGWHIECSAMAKAHLGSHIDIHGGGLDLQFPHHENEIAQSEACNGEVFANYWLHVGMLQLNHEKMAKSTGNFLTIKDALKRYHAEVIKLFYMSSHYRSPLNFTDEALQQAHKSLQRLYQTIKTYSHLLTSDFVLDTEWVKRFEDAMNDDFNTPQALAILFELNNQMNKTPNANLFSTLMYLANLLGILHSDANTFLQFSINEEQFTEQEIEMYIEKRKKARLDKDFAEADRIRHFLLEKGIELEDQVGVTSWRRRI